MSEYEGVGANLDDLFQFGVDNDKAAETEKKLLLPADSYISTPPLSVTASVNDEGRKVFNVFGAWEGRKEGRTGRFGFRFSPDLKEVENQRTGQIEPDRMSKNWVMVRRAYISAFGSAPETLADIKGYLTQYPVIARLIQIGTQPGATGEPGNMVVMVSAVRD